MCNYTITFCGSQGTLSESEYLPPLATRASYYNWIYIQLAELSTSKTFFYFLQNNNI